MGGIRLRVGLGCGIGLFDCALWICLRWGLVVLAVMWFAVD